MDTEVTPESLALLTPEAARQVLHELQVHRIKLEMQNETLRRSQLEMETSRTRYLQLYDLSPVGNFTLNEQGMIQQANLSAADLLGMTRETLLQQRFTRFVCPLDQDIYYRYRKLLLETSTPQVTQLRMINKDGAHFWIRIEATLVKHPDKSLDCLLVVSDINELKINEERLRQAAALFESAREGVMVTDPETHILLVNQGFTTMTGYAEDEVRGQTPRLLQSGRQDGAFYAAMWADIHATGYWQGEILNRLKSGEVCPQLLSISTVHDKLGQVINYVGVVSDIRQIKDEAARLDYLAHHDPLTGLPNRLLLFARIEHCIDASSRQRKCAAVLILDLDRFKEVNDHFGHLAGDELLRQVAQRLTSRLRGVDTVSRLGGDEFVVLLEDLSHPQDAAQVAQAIIDALDDPWHLSNGTDVRIGTSIGISLYPEHGQSTEALLQSADAALYRAKGEGGGTFQYFSHDLTDAAVRRMNLESLLRRAVACNELRVHYQPQIDIASGHLVGAEALVRWQSPAEGLMLPSHFIPAAEGTGMISSIGEWVLRETCRQGQQWIEAGLPPLNLAVNLAFSQFRHGDISAKVAKVLADTGFPAERLELELTESALMEKESEAVETLRRLRALGVRLAIDDFGTGYSSLAHLQRFPLDMLKIDKGFIDDIQQQPNDREITTAIIGMGHTLGLKVLAEGVETVAQFEFLKAHGCDLYQGYFKSAAVPAEVFVEFLQGAECRADRSKPSV